jgi:hypothetical protein
MIALEARSRVWLAAVRWLYDATYGDHSLVSSLDAASAPSKHALKEEISIVWCQ